MVDNSTQTRRSPARMLAAVAMLLGAFGMFAALLAPQVSASDGLQPVDSVQNIPANATCGPGNLGTFYKFTTGGNDAVNVLAGNTNHDLLAIYSFDEAEGHFTIDSLTLADGTPVLVVEVASNAAGNKPLWKLPAPWTNSSEVIQTSVGDNLSQFALCVFDDIVDLTLTKTTVPATAGVTFTFTVTCSVFDVDLGTDVVLGTFPVSVTTDATGAATAPVTSLMPVGAECSVVEDAVAGWEANLPMPVTLSETGPNDLAVVNDEIVPTATPIPTTPPATATPIPTTPPATATPTPTTPPATATPTPTTPPGVTPEPTATPIPTTPPGVTPAPTATPEPTVGPPLPTPPSPAIMVNKVYVGFVDNDGSGDVTPGDVLLYDLTAQNIGDVTLTNVTIYDTLTDETYPCADSLATGITCPVNDFPIRVEYTVTFEDAAAGLVENDAVASGEYVDPDGVWPSETLTDETDEPVLVQIIFPERPEGVDGVLVEEPAPEDEVEGTFIDVAADEPASVDELAYTGTETVVIGASIAALLAAAGATMSSAGGVAGQFSRLRRRK